jgi:hypothetical protein
MIIGMIKAHPTQDRMPRQAGSQAHGLRWMLLALDILAAARR